MRRRGSGVLLHITSLPGDFGTGDFGPGAYRFADFLEAAGQSVWQILPMGPTSPAIGNSPYSSSSAYAGNRLFISPDKLARDGFIHESDIGPRLADSAHTANYEAAEQAKERVLRAAFGHRENRLDSDPGFQGFCRKNAYWLDDFALFTVIKNRFHGQVWDQWPAELRDRHHDALHRVTGEMHTELNYIKFVQYLFNVQWNDLKTYCNERRIQMVGDAPIYVTFDSADVWANPQYFKLDHNKHPRAVAGVPPDYFSETGQLWGNPVFDWDALKRDNYNWWVRRVGRNIELYDMIRIDHFRGFAGYWEIPYGEKTAINGQWVEAPGMEFFDALAARFASLPIIAEDLGVITPDVRELRDTFNLPGMKIVQFSFGNGIGKNVDALHNHVPNCVAYTGTHDNNTTRGWFKAETTAQDRERLAEYLGLDPTEDNIAWSLVRLTMSSCAHLAVFPMQDLLGLDETARMNTPSIANGNWCWRVAPHQLDGTLEKKLRELTLLFGRI
ncbi:MAG: 4-alpha-glucanotransferase [Desulfovibrio sp.]|uniref:4-alpha-glucanotransferase n=1 Tax=Desulfovibrio sp. 7SRBS1 TaxID=3378064 RepID=UPI003B3C78EB